MVKQHGDWTHSNVLISHELTGGPSVELKKKNKNKTVKNEKLIADFFKSEKIQRPTCTRARYVTAREGVHTVGQETNICPRCHGNHEMTPNEKGHGPLKTFRAMTALCI